MKPALLLSAFLALLALRPGPLAAAPGDEPVAAVTAERILPQIRDQLAAQFRVDGELQVDLQRTWLPPTTPATPWEIRVITPPTSLASQVIVRVRLVADQRNLGEWTLPVHVQHWLEVLVAREPVARGGVLGAAQFDLRRVDILREKDAVPATANLENLTVARPLAAGVVLSWHDLLRRPLVQRGERIEVVATDGTLTITMKGQAMQSGALGETILVRNPDSRRDFTATVSGENQARVAF